MNNKFVIIGILVIVFLTASLSFGFAHGIKNENKGINGMAKMQNADVWNKGDMIGHNSAHMGMDNMDNMGRFQNYIALVLTHC